MKIKEFYMGWTYTVAVWMVFDEHLYSNKKEPRYEYVVFYEGNSFLKMCFTMFKHKVVKKNPCVKLEWR